MDEIDEERLRCMQVVSGIRRSLEITEPSMPKDATLNVGNLLKVIEKMIETGFGVDVLVGTYHKQLCRSVGRPDLINELKLGDDDGEAPVHGE